MTIKNFTIFLTVFLPAATAFAATQVASGVTETVMTVVADVTASVTAVSPAASPVTKTVVPVVPEPKRLAAGTADNKKKHYNKTGKNIWMSGAPASVPGSAVSDKKYMPISGTARENAIDMLTAASVTNSSSSNHVYSEETRVSKISK
jgi:hypothetical protein